MDQPTSNWETNLTTKQKLSLRFNKAKNSKAVKTSLAILAVGVGAYFGTKKQYAQIASDVKYISQAAGNISMSLDEMILEKDEFRHSQKEAIEDLIKEGQGFTHFPGVGVLDHRIYDRNKKK
jgi:hypothetical protein